MEFTTQSFPFFKTSLEDMVVITIGIKDEYDRVRFPNKYSEFVLNTKYCNNVNAPKITIRNHGDYDTLGIWYNFRSGIIRYEPSAITGYEKESDNVLKVKLHPEEFLHTGDVIENEDEYAGTFIAVKCTIPKGTKYFEEDGKILTDCIIPTSFEEIM